MKFVFGLEIEDWKEIKGTAFIITIQDPALCDNNGNAGGDHFAVSVQLHKSKPLKERKTITFRKLRKIDIHVYQNLEMT